MKYLTFALIALLAAPLAAQAPPSPAGALPLDALTLPPGFSIAVYAEGVQSARQMALGDKGTVFVGSRQAGKVFAVVDSDGDHKADKVHTIASGLQSPTGIAFRDGALYVAAISTITRYDAIEANLETPPAPVVVTDKLPTETHHGWKFLAFGPDGLLYVPVGAPCNVCERPDDERFATILRMKPDGSDVEVYARGVRNSVGFDWHPVTGALYFTDNGRDNLGDDLPSDELNYAPKPGLNFGFPYCHQGDTPDPELGAKHACSEFQPPAGKMGPHVAAIGMTFYTGSMFPPEYKNRAIIAQHGSWNRTTPIGYRVMSAVVDAGTMTTYEPLVTGWLREPKPAEGNAVWGRPADVLQLPDGSLLVADDFANVLYRVTYSR
jgi:glucose/arabinose dehydrogenase